jgi:hypothetical protein
MLTNQVLWWPNLLWKVELCYGGYLLQKKIHKKEKEMGDGERRVDRQVIN